MNYSDRVKLNAWHTLLRSYGCLICGAPTSLHHVVGGSIVERIGERGSRKHSDWLVLNLCPLHHQGQEGIHHLGVETWERTFGTQADMLDKLGQQHGIDLWSMAEEERMAKRAARRTKPAKPRASKGNTASPSKMLPRG